VRGRLVIGVSSCRHRISIYTNAAGSIPIAEAILGKGAAPGAVLAFMLRAIALSLPEMIILRPVLRLRLVSALIGVVGSGIPLKTNTVMDGAMPSFADVAFDDSYPLGLGGRLSKWFIRALAAGRTTVSCGLRSVTSCSLAKSFSSSGSSASVTPV